MRKHIKIGHIRYRIKKIKRLNDGAAGVMYGQIDYGKSLIELDADMGPQHDRQTLWHEVIHAIMNHAGIQKHDEPLVEIMASGIMQVINDNPEMGRRTR